MISPSATFDPTISLSSRSAVSTVSASGAIVDIEQQIRLIDQQIESLRKAKRKLAKIEDELSNCNFLIDSGIGSKADKTALRQTKRQLRQRRIQLWEKLEPLPALQAERGDLSRDLDGLRRRHGILIDDIL